MRIIFFTIFLIFLTGCSLKTLKSSTASVILLKTKSFKFYDSGFVEIGKNTQNLKIFNAGVPILDIKIKKDRVCFDFNCFRDEIFNQKFLSKHYERDFLQKLVLKKPLFDSKNIKYSENGFTQTIKEVNKFDIIYRQNPNETYFKDRKNRVLIKIRKIDE